MNKIKEICFSSATVAGTYIFGGISLALDALATYPDMLDDNVKGAITTIFGTDPASTAHVMLMMSGTLFIARMRSLSKKTD